MFSFIIFFRYNFLLLSFSLFILFSCYQGSRDSCRRVRQDAPGPDGTLHRGQHRQDGRQGLSQLVCPTSVTAECDQCKYTSNYKSSSWRPFLTSSFTYLRDRQFTGILLLENQDFESQAVVPVAAEVAGIAHFILWFTINVTTSFVRPRFLHWSAIYCSSLCISCMILLPYLWYSCHTCQGGN